jgi:nicotinamidase-related amidase
VAVVHVQHDGGLGNLLAKGSPGWPHHALVAPRAGEVVVEKRHSSAFHDTDLHRRLTDAGIDRLVVAGMQTEMCVDYSAMTFASAVGPAPAAKRCTSRADGAIRGKVIAL